MIKDMLNCLKIHLSLSASCNTMKQICLIITIIIVSYYCIHSFFLLLVKFDMLSFSQNISYRIPIHIF